MQETQPKQSRNDEPSRNDELPDNVRSDLIDKPGKTPSDNPMEGLGKAMTDPIESAADERDGVSEGMREANEMDRRKKP